MGKIYAISDIHGCLREFKTLLKKINFCNDDILYILGDCVDRGPEPIKLLHEMMLYPNIIPICGNHDFIALNLLKTLIEEVTEQGIEKITLDFFMDLQTWQNDGGDTTLKQFGELSYDERIRIIEYMGEFSCYETVEILDKIIELQRKYGQDKVIALLGNHEEMFLSGFSPLDDDNPNIDGDKYISFLSSLPLYR